MTCKGIDYACDGTDTNIPSELMISFSELLNKNPNISLNQIMRVMIDATENYRGFECYPREMTVPKSNSATEQYDHGGTVHDIHLVRVIGLGTTTGVLFILLVIVITCCTGVLIWQHRKLRAMADT